MQNSVNQAQTSQQISYIKDLKPNLKNLNLQVIVLDICKPTTTKDGHEVRSVRVADRTGSINLSVWNNYGAQLKEGDIVKLTGCYTQIWKLSLQLKISTKGALSKCGDFMMLFNEQPDMSILSNEALKMVQEQQGNGGPGIIGAKPLNNSNGNSTSSNGGSNGGGGGGGSNQTSWR